MIKCTVPVVAAFIALSAWVHAATPEQEKAFVEAYRTALEAGDTKALTAFLYTKGAEPDTIEMFKMMQSMDAGKKVTTIELVTPSAEQIAAYNQPQEMPDGKMYVMPFAPTRQLVVTIVEESSKSTSRRPVGEKDGRLVIPVPVPAK